MDQPKSDKLIMNPHLKRLSTIFAIIAFYLVSFKNTKILSKVPAVELKLQKPKSPEIQSKSDAEISASSSEPYKNRWQRRFSNNTQGYFFFKHIRKAGGTSLRSYFRDVFNYHGVKYTTRDDYPKIHKGRVTPGVLYVEHEFQSMDSECASVDGRWDKSLRVITLRVSHCYSVVCCLHVYTSPSLNCSYYQRILLKDICRSFSSRAMEQNFTSIEHNSTQTKHIRSNYQIFSMKIFHYGWNKKGVGRTLHVNMEIMIESITCILDDFIETTFS